ncbi:MAG TPA: penicillin-binding protein 2 [Terriglobales bacterium]|jgi:penicillin-binding protein 2|nr:penicillin-binding protein 2 [Terriglobales bacterium]
MQSREEKISGGKLTAIQYIILAIFLVLGGRLWQLQVARSEEYDAQAERNQTRMVPILAPRGKIYDREGRLLVDNYPSFSALLLRDYPRDLNQDLPLIAAGLNMQVKDIQDRIRRFASQPKFQPMTLKDDLTPDELAFVESHRNELPELDTIMANRRLYPPHGFAAHLIGYVGEVSEQMLDDPAYELYEAGDVVGKSGIEKQYNDMLIGQDGSRRTVVNSHGKEIRQLDQIPPIPGKPLKLTIDLDLQIAMEEALEGHNGAMVAINPRNGEVLAMASRPTFDSNAFSVRISRAEWNQLLTDPAKPLLNKAIQAQLSPGSTFKIVMSVAGLQEGIAQNMHVFCAGGKEFYGRFFKCDAKHGDVDISKGIYKSCDTFFYTLGERLGIGRIAKYAMGLGLGQKTHIDLPEEASGIMPSEEWKIKNFKQKWYAGETISVSIGQGGVIVTPIQLARTIGGIAMGGVLHRPHVAFPDQLPDQYKQVLAQYPDEVDVPIDPSNVEIITDAMAGVTGPQGTAAVAHLEGIDFAGKTGTAQTISNEARKKLKLSANKFKDNGWFVGMTPRRNPDIVVAGVVESGGWGASTAPLVAQVIKAYVDKQRKIPTKVADSNKPAEMTGIWSTPDKDSPSGERLQAGRFVLPAARRSPAIHELFATSVPAAGLLGSGKK